jgi:sugar (pentulose or hexulose) kinase
MTGPVYLGIDLGTQSVRVMAVTEAGEVAASASTSLTSYRNGIRHEQQPEEWWSATARSCRSVMNQLADAKVLGLAVDATSGTIIVMDSHLRPFGPALMYDDGRAREEAAEVNQVGSSQWQEMSYRIQPSWALPKAVWLDRNGSIPHGSRVVHQNDFINARLAGKFLPTDSSNALKTGYDLIRKEWPAEVMETLRFDTSRLPEVVSPGDLIGEVCLHARNETGIPSGVPIYAGMTDGCAAQIASGTISAGSWNSVIGTTLVIKGVTHDRIHDPRGVIYSHRSPDGMWLPGGASSTGAGIIAKEFDRGELDRLNEAALRREPTGLSAYPLLGRGERFPFSAPEAEAFTIGNTNSKQMRYCSVLEGIACIERLSFDVLRSLGARVDGDFAISGGATNSEALNQIRANILQRSLTIPSVPESVFGMAVLAAASSSSLQKAVRQMVHISRVIEPSRSFSDYAEQYSKLIDELERRGWLSQALAATTLEGIHS